MEPHMYTMSLIVNYEPMYMLEVGLNVSFRKSSANFCCCFFYQTLRESSALSIFNTLKVCTIIVFTCLMDDICRRVSTNFSAKYSKKFIVGLDFCVPPLCFRSLFQLKMANYLLAFQNVGWEFMPLYTCSYIYMLIHVT